MSTASLNDLAARHVGDGPGDYRDPCPLCAKKANDGAVSTTVKPDGTVVAHCHRCGESGTARPERVNGSRRPAARTKAARPPEDHVALWDSGVEPGEAFEYPYLARKKVGAHGIRIAGDLLLVPMRNVAGQLVGVQKIGADGTKLYTRGAKKTGAFHLIGEADDRIVIAEGYGTGASIFEATGTTVAIAFDCGNLARVATAIRGKYPTTTIIIAADDDVGTAGNPGLTAATEAARAGGGKVAVPDFGDDRPEGATDFNDLRNHRGDEAVHQCLVHPKAVEQEVSDGDSPLAYVFAHELEDNGDEADELVERLLARGAMGVIYGDSNSGKTFLAIDVACAVARGLAWMGRNVEPGMIVYLATESPASVRRRLRAYQRHHNCKVPNFVIVQSPINLYDGAADTKLVIDLVHKLDQRLGVKCELVIGDTLSRLCAGANENSGEDMSIVVRHVDRIRHECNVHFLLIHHTGKDAAKGMRGWSGMRAATDTEIEITSDEETGTHAAEVTKQRDIPGKGDRIGFWLQVVEMGIGKWGKPVTSCVVLSADAPKKAQAKRPSEIAGAITEVLTTRGAGMRKRDLVDHFEGRYTSSAVYRELKRMAADGKLREAVGVVALVPIQ